MSFLIGVAIGFTCTAIGQIVWGKRGWWAGFVVAVIIVIAMGI